MHGSIRIGRPRGIPLGPLITLPTVLVDYVPAHHGTVVAIGSNVGGIPVVGLVIHVDFLVVRIGKACVSWPASSTDVDRSMIE